MYEVVGCDRCGSLWIRSGDAETSTCPRCGKRHQVKRLKALARSESADGAREARTQLLAERRAEDPSHIAGFNDVAEAASEPIITEADHLESAGIDIEAVAAAGERATASPTKESHQATIQRILNEEETATRDEIVEQATEADIDPATTEAILTGLIQRGDIVKTTDGYRMV